MDEWGKEIAVNGVRPAWLADDDRVQWAHAFSGNVCEVAGLNFTGDKGGTPVATIRLRADHWAYIAINDGFEPWGGGDEAPADWDEGGVLTSDGHVKPVAWICDWSWLGSGPNIIGYRKKPVAVGFAHSTLHPLDSYALRPSWRVERQVHGIRNRAESDAITIKRMTEAEARKLFPWDAMLGLQKLGLIREETTAERFARETGFEVTPAVEAALGWEKAA